MKKRNFLVSGVMSAVLDGLACAVGLCESMVRLGLKTSRHGGYAPPPASKRELTRA